MLTHTKQSGKQQRKRENEQEKRKSANRFHFVFCLSFYYVRYKMTETGVQPEQKDRPAFSLKRPNVWHSAHPPQNGRHKVDDGWNTNGVQCVTTMARR